jgi:flagellar biosynthesis/type III secretory pathway chaperone
MDSPTDTARLAQLVTLKHDVLLHLRQLAQRQLDIVASEDVERLLGLLAEKQTLLAQLQRIERTLDPYRCEDPDRRTWAASEDRQRCQAVADRANQLLAEVLALEQQAEQRLLGQRNRAARELEDATHARAARQAYVGAANSSPAGLNLLSET